MPSRDDSGAKAPQRQRARAQASTGTKSPKQGDDVWDEVMSMKSGGGAKAKDGEFDKMNTMFYLKDSDGVVDIVVLDNNPVVFFSHTIKAVSQGGKEFYRTEACQKLTGMSCVMCETNNASVGKSRKTIGFRLLDSRGAYDSETKDFDGDPAPKIMLTPLYLAKQFKALKDDGDGDLTDKVIKLQKNAQYIANFKMKKEGGAMQYVEAPEYDGDLPDILEVYAPLSDDDLIDFIDEFGATAIAPRKSGRGSGKSTGFGS